MAHIVRESIALLGEACASVDQHCARGLEPDRDRIRHNLEQNLMVVTALNPHIGYDKGAQIAKKAHAEGTTLREAAIASGHLSAEEFDQWVDPMAMTRAD